MTPATPSALKVILFTDLVDSTGWKRTLGDRDYAEKLRQPHDKLFRELLQEYPGALERDNAGDGFLATFATPGDAVTFALRFQHELKRHPWDGPDRQPATRIGIHLGEVVEYADLAGLKISGQAVDLAARVMGLGLGGQTLLTRHAFDSARQHVRANPIDANAPLAWPYHGQYRFKGNEGDPLEVFEVGTPAAPLAAPPDGDKAKRVAVDAADDTGSWRPAAGLAIPRKEGWFLEKQIGEGGFGEVWLARNRRTKETRVFKFCFDADRLRSFKRELTFFRLIQSELGDRPDIVKLLDVQVEKPPYFLESEYIPGGNLGDWVESHGGLETWPVAERIAFVAGVARAAAAAHSLGIIHKDLKPSNIFVRLDKDNRPQPILADFGIGVLADRSRLEKANVTETGFTESVMFGNDSSRTGTRLYAPPEAQVGKPATTGFDVYALGVLLFQMLAGDLKRPLGTGWEEEVGGERADLLKEDIRAATLTDDKKRLPTASGLAERLENLEARSAERTLEVRAANQARRMRAMKRALGLAVGVLVLVGGMAGYAWEQRGIARAKGQFAQQKEKEAKSETIKTKAANDELDSKVASLSIATQFAADAAFANLRADRALKLLDGIPPYYRGFDWHYRQRSFTGGFETIQEQRIGVINVAFSPNGTNIFAAFAFGHVGKWDTSSGKKMAALDLDEELTCAALSPDGSRIVACSGKAVKVWDAVTGAALTTFTGNKNPVICLAFNSDGSRLATGSSDNTIQIWDAATGGELGTLIGHTGPVVGVAFSPDGSVVASGSYDMKVKLWNVTTGTEVFSLDGHMDVVTGVAFSPDGTLVASSSRDNTVKVWDVVKGVQRATLSGHKGWVNDLAFGPDGSCIATASRDTTAKLWDTATGTEINTFAGHNGPVSSIAFSLDGSRIATGSNKTIKFWDVLSGAEQSTLAGHMLGTSLAFSPDGSRLASGSGNGKISLWDSVSGAEGIGLRGHQGWVSAVSFSYDGSRIVSGSWDKTVKLWDGRTGVEMATMVGHTDRVTSVSFSGDGSLLASGSADKTVKVWNADTGTLRFTLEGHIGAVTGVAFCRNQLRVVSGSSDGTLKIWDVGSGKLQMTLTGHKGPVSCVAFSPDSSRVGSGSDDKTVKVWDLSTGGTRVTLDGHQTAVTSVVFGTDGSQIISGSWDNTIKIWDVATGEERLTLTGHKSVVLGVALSPDGSRIASGSADNTIKIWHGEDRDRPEQKLAYLRSKSTFKPFEAEVKYNLSDTPYAKAFWKSRFAYNLPNNPDHWAAFRKECIDEPTYRLMKQTCDLVLLKGPNALARQQRQWAVEQLAKQAERLPPPRAVP